MPTKGQQKLIDLIDSMPIQDIPGALDNFPLPFAVTLISGGSQTVINGHAGSPIKIDVDRLTSTGQGNSGNDMNIEVNTEPFPVPRLVVEFDRLGSTPFAEDVTVVFAVPWNGFNDETLPDRPNLFFGFRTSDVFDAITQGYPVGGNAPDPVRIEFTPGAVAVTDHDLNAQIDVSGADNPIRFLAGHFDGTDLSGIQNVLGLGAHVDPVPASITLGFTINNSALFQPSFQTSFDLSWQASAPARVTFDYIENEPWHLANPVPHGFGDHFDPFDTDL